MTIENVRLFAAVLLLSCTGAHAAPDAGVDCARALGSFDPCPDGCRGYSGREVDPARRCETGCPVAMACFPGAAAVGMNGEMGCFTRDGVTVVTGSTNVAVVGGSEDLFAEHGWVRCADPTPIPPCP